MSRTAQEWADHLHDADGFEHRPDNLYGENLYWTGSTRRSPGTVATNALQKWYAESTDYDYTREMTPDNINYDVPPLHRHGADVLRQNGRGLKQGSDGTYVAEPSLLWRASPGWRSEGLSGALGLAGALGLVGAALGSGGFADPAHALLRRARAGPSSVAGLRRWLRGEDPQTLHLVIGDLFLVIGESIENLDDIHTPNSIRDQNRKGRSGLHHRVKTAGHTPTMAPYGTHLCRQLATMHATGKQTKQDGHDPQPPTKTGHGNSVRHTPDGGGRVPGRRSSNGGWKADHPHLNPAVSVTALKAATTAENGGRNGFSTGASPNHRTPPRSIREGGNGTNVPNRCVSAPRARNRIRLT
ncbi:hypothetical protein JOD27_007368 [Lentzea nigeriaca]|nr:hypothetical protein [Lentzea nigeriaca]